MIIQSISLVEFKVNETACSFPQANTRFNRSVEMGSSEKIALSKDKYNVK